MKKILIASIFVFAVSAFTVSPVYAGGHCSGSKCSSDKSKDCKVTKLKETMSLYWAYAEQLGLSADQLGKIAEIKHDAMKEMIRDYAESKVIKVDIKTELWQSQIDAGKTVSLIDQKYEAKAKVAKTMVKAFADAQAVLTQEQREHMVQIKVSRYIDESGILDVHGKACQKG